MNVADSRRLAESLGAVRADGRRRAARRPTWWCCTRASCASRPRTACTGNCTRCKQMKAAAAEHEGGRGGLRQRHPRLAQALSVRRPDRRAGPGPDRARSADRPARPLRALSLRPRPGGAHPGHLRRRDHPPGLQSARARTASCRPRAAASGVAHRRSSSTRCARWSSAARARWCCSARSSSATAATCDRACCCSELAAAAERRSPGLERIRFLTSYPGDFGRDLVDAVADLPKVCEDVNLPIQAGDDDVLRRMHRGYVVDHYRQLIGRLRERMPDIGLSTDVIVGFPGETRRRVPAHAGHARRVPLRRGPRGDVLAAAGTVAATRDASTTCRAKRSGAACTRSRCSRSRSPPRSTRATSAAPSTCWSKAPPKAAGTAARAPTNWSTSPASAAGGPHRRRGDHVDRAVVPRRASPREALRSRHDSGCEQFWPEPGPDASAHATARPAQASERRHPRVAADARGEQRGCRAPAARPGQTLHARVASSARR